MLGGVIEWRFTTEDVARVRFAFSPLLEAVLSLIVLRAPARHALHLPWIQSVRPRVAALDLNELFALVPVRGIVADFLTLPPESPLPDLDTELDAVRHVPLQQVISDLKDIPGIPAAIVDRIAADTHGALDRIADTLHAYWELALAEHWPRIRALLEADVLWRSRRLAVGGARDLFDDLHESVSWHGDRLTVADRWHHCGALTGEGLLLVSSAMVWPGVRKEVHPYQPMLAYPVRGIATLWETGTPPADRTLGSLIGHTRAQLLNALTEPNTTTGLARRLTITAGAVSQHLKVLRDNGLVAGTRVGAVVLYHRTARGDALATRD